MGLFLCCATSGLGSLRVDNMLQNKPTVATSNCAGSVPTPVNTCISNTWAPPFTSSAWAPHLSYNHLLLPSLHSCQFSPFHPMPKAWRFPCTPCPCHLPLLSRNNLQDLAALQLPKVTIHPSRQTLLWALTQRLHLCTDKCSIKMPLFPLNLFIMFAWWLCLTYFNELTSVLISYFTATTNSVFPSPKSVVSWHEIFELSWYRRFFT